MGLVNSLQWYESDSPVSREYQYYKPNNRPVHDPDHSHNHGPNIHGLSNPEPDLGPWHFMRFDYSRTTLQNGQA